VKWWKPGKPFAPVRSFTSSKNSRSQKPSASKEWGLKVSEITLSSDLTVEAKAELEQFLSLLADPSESAEVALRELLAKDAVGVPEMAEAA
jgi:hypothetical protein